MGESTKLASLLSWLVHHSEFETLAQSSGGPNGAKSLRPDRQPLGTIRLRDKDKGKPSSPDLGRPTPGERRAPLLRSQRERPHRPPRRHFPRREPARENSADPRHHRHVLLAL